MSPFAIWTLSQEARALLARLSQVRPFALLEPMVPAAALLPATQTAIESQIVMGRREVHARVTEFLHWLASPGGRRATAAEAQRRFAFLRLRFNAMLTQVDLFDDVITQRSEHETGVWLSGLDVVSADALALDTPYYSIPPIICYLDRGIGAAIRRARTRLPGGGSNPVAIIRVPRERMVGSGIASSLIHEVGHQAAALLNLVNSLQPVLRGMQSGSAADRLAWSLWERWISEIIADFWSVGRVGICSTIGLMGVVSLPQTFVFRLNTDDPHPTPWIRVLLSCAIGQALYPHPQWQRQAALWHSLYRTDDLAPEKKQMFSQLLATMPAFVNLLVNHRPLSLHGRTLIEVLAVRQRQPAQLARLFLQWSREPEGLYCAAPTLAFAVLGQARANGVLSPEDESTLLARLLTHWALHSTLVTASLLTRLSNSTAVGLVQSKQKLTTHSPIGG